MVKRHNKTGRRQILQLEDKKPAPAFTIKSTKNISNNDCDIDDQQNPPSPEHQPSTSSEPLDLQVADFLKEIDALTEQEEISKEISEAESAQTFNVDVKDVSKPKNKYKKKKRQDDSTESTSAFEGVQCMWKEICDDSTGYSYYWNMQTNEVTWDCPPEYLEFIQLTKLSAERTETAQPSLKSKNHQRKQKKKEPQKIDEGAIIPISYFGSSSTSESSSENSDGEISRPFKKHKSESGNASKKHRLKTEMTVTSEPIGPQLPPDFQFPGQSSENEVDEYLEIGPQLPDTYYVNQEACKVRTADSCDQESNASELLPSQSNGTSTPAESSVQETSWEESLLDMERQFKSSSKTEEFPDSTTRKDKLSSMLKVPSPVHTSNVAYGYRPVVEYDSFTDDDDDQEEIDLGQSTSKTNENSAHVVSSGHCSDRELDLDFMGVEVRPEIIEMNKILPESESEILCTTMTTEKIEESSENNLQTLSEKAEEIEEKCIQPVFQNIEQNEESGLQSLFQKVECNQQNIHPSSQLLVKGKENISQSLFQNVEQNKANDLQPLSPEVENKENSLQVPFQTAERNTNISMQPSSHKSRWRKKSCAQPSSTNELSSKTKPIDIDSLFASHTYGFGFGFNKDHQLQSESHDLCSSSNQSYSASFKDRSNYSSMSFVKSKQVLDLSSLNKDLVFNNYEKEDDKTEQSDSENASQCQEVQMDDDMSDGESSNVTELFPAKADITTLEVPVSISDENLLSSIKKDIAARRKNRKVVVGRKGNKDAVLTQSIDMETDEIDKALSDALEEKKASDCLSLKPSTLSQDELAEQKDTVTSQSGVAVKVLETDDDQSSNNNSTIMASTIVELSSLLGDKLSFLHSNHSTMTSVTGFLIQLQTRLMDWQGGALDGKYFLARLQEVQVYLQHYESSLVPGEWTCQWDREHKRYFYVNVRTQVSQWTFPGTQEKPPWMNSTEVASTSSSSYPMAGAQFPLVSSSMVEQKMHEESVLQSYPTSSQWQDRASPPPPPPGVDSPPPPLPPQSPPSRSPPPPPPDSTKIVEEASQDMDLEDSNSSDDSPFMRGLDVTPGPPGVVRTLFPCKFVSECSSSLSPEHFPTTTTINAVSSTSTILGRVPPAAALHQHNTNPAQVPSVTLPVPPPSTNSDVESLIVTMEVGNERCYQPDVTDLSSGLATERRTLGNDDSVPSTSGAALNAKAVDSSASSSSTGLVAKKEKKKVSKLQAGLALKKKNMQSLVQKWQRIKEEQEKEDKDDEARISTSM